MGELNLVELKRLATEAEQERQSRPFWIYLASLARMRNSIDSAGMLTLLARLAESEAANARMAGALEFYANQDNYSPEGAPVAPADRPYHQRIRDFGARAKQALAALTPAEGAKDKETDND